MEDKFRSTKNATKEKLARSLPYKLEKKVCTQLCHCHSVMGPAARSTKNATKEKLARSYTIQIQKKTLYPTSPTSLLGTHKVCPDRKPESPPQSLWRATLWIPQSKQLVSLPQNAEDFGIDGLLQKPPTCCTIPSMATSHRLQMTVINLLMPLAQSFLPKLPVHIQIKPPLLYGISSSIYNINLDSRSSRPESSSECTQQTLSSAR